MFPDDDCGQTPTTWSCGGVSIIRIVRINEYIKTTIVVCYAVWMEIAQLCNEQLLPPRFGTRRLYYVKLEAIALRIKKEVSREA